jgi:hypothetical protein
MDNHSPSVEPGFNNELRWPIRLKSRYMDVSSLLWFSLITTSISLMKIGQLSHLGQTVRIDASNEHGHKAKRHSPSFQSVGQFVLII